MSDFELDLLAQIPRLRRYARALLGRISPADDLVQDCLERAWTRSAQWRRGSNLRAWLFSIMHNLYVDQLRRDRRQPETFEFDERDQVTRPQQENHQALSELEAGLATLPQEQREVLLLVALEGLAYEEVAVALDIPLGTVMSRLYRARERMRRWMEGGAAPQLRSVK